MKPWPHEATPLTDAEKNAYRALLYWTMLHVRDLCQPRVPISPNPLLWWKQYRQSRIAGALADWQHNLAYFAAKDFTGFDANWFWAEYDGLCQRFNQLGPGKYIDYKKRYEERLAA